MRRLATLTVVALLLLGVLAPMAQAAPPHDGCPVGPNGPGGTTIEGWQRWSETTYADALVAAGVYDEEGAEASAHEVYESEDKNGDGLLCIMVQVLPNDASGFDTWFVSHDNNSNARS